MQTRRLGQAELEFTAVGLGTWALGGPWEVGWGPQDDGLAIDTILAGIDLGINWIDTAPIYGTGHAEERSQWSIQWVLRRPEITAAIVGARSPAQIAETVQAMDQSLCENRIQEIEQHLHTFDETVSCLP